MFRHVWQKYLTVLNQRPLSTQMVQSSVIMAVGDVIAQKVVEKHEGFDVVRTARFAMMGTFFVAPIIRGWYLTLVKMVGTKLSPVKATLAKVAMDQLAFAPVFNGSFLTVIGLLQGKSLGNINEKLKKEYKDVMLTNWKLWPAVQLVNFFFVPFNLRPLVVSCVALIWNTFLSWKSNSSPAHESS